jgi:hypothetical protein
MITTTYSGGTYRESKVRTNAKAGFSISGGLTIPSRPLPVKVGAPTTNLPPASVSLVRTVDSLC